MLYFEIIDYLLTNFLLQILLRKKISPVINCIVLQKIQSQLALACHKSEWRQICYFHHLGSTIIVL